MSDRATLDFTPPNNFPTTSERSRVPIARGGNRNNRYDIVAAHAWPLHNLHLTHLRLTLQASHTASITRLNITDAKCI